MLLSTYDGGWSGDSHIASTRDHLISWSGLISPCYLLLTNNEPTWLVGSCRHDHLLSTEDQRFKSLHHRKSSLCKCPPTALNQDPLKSSGRYKAHNQLRCDNPSDRKLVVTTLRLWTGLPLKLSVFREGALRLCRCWPWVRIHGSN